MVTSQANYAGRTVHIREIYKPLPSQARLADAMYDRKYILFGGAAGPGKSYGLRWSAVELLMYWAAQGHRGVRVGLFCEDYPTLKDRQISRMQREFPPWMGYLKETKEEGFAYHLYPDWGGGVIALRNLDDPAKYASAEWAAEFIDELTKNPRQMFDDLRFRLRWPGIEHNPFVAGSNPGSIGHAWVKKLWVDRDFTGDDERLNPDDFLFIPARAGENPYLPQSYWKTLNSLPTAMRRAMLEGDWNVFEGQVFSEWRNELHTCEPFRVPADWTCWVSIDYGFAAPFCALWWARPPDKSRLYIYRELYQAGWRATEQARRILALSEGQKVWKYAADPSMWQKRRETTGDSLADEYRQAGIKLSQANNDRMAGLNAIREALNWKELPNGRLIKPPRLQVFNTCRNLIRTLPGLPYDSIKVEDVDTDAEDHAFDAARYGIMVDDLRPWKAPPPMEVYGESDPWA
jgi:phage terminase large subunit